MPANWIDEPQMKRALIEGFIGSLAAQAPSLWDLHTDPPMPGRSQVSIQPETMLGPFSAVAERVALAEVLRRRLSEVVLKQIRWGGHINSSKERIVFSALDGRPVYPKDLQGLAQTYRITQNMTFCDVFKYGDTIGTGFTNSGMSGGDGKPLFANDHPLYDGAAATFDNLLADCPLTEDNAVLMLDLWANAVDEHNRSLMIYPDTIWCGPMNARKAAQIVGSEREPSTANNAINAVFYGWKVLVLPHLIGTTHGYKWGMLNSTLMREAIVREEAQALQISADVPDLTIGAVIIAADSIQGVGIKHAFWVSGCPATTKA